jgi:DNA-binding NarL/FixJ family response regulator
MIADISVLLVDDHAVVREGYKRLLELSPDVNVAGEAADAAEAYQKFCALQPDVVVMDLALPGARGYVTKASAPDVLVEAVRSVARRVSYLSPDVSQALALRASIQEGRQLSAREFEVLRLLVQGYTLPSIAEKLGLSQKTVANHQSAIRQKFGADNGVQLARTANRLGLHFADFASSAAAAFGPEAGNGSPA